MAKPIERFMEPAFELSGGALCLDFANTLDDRPRGHNEKLGGYRDLLAFAAQTGSLEPPEIEALARRARRGPPEAAKALADAIDLRECLYRMFAALAGGRSPAGRDLARLNRALSATLGKLRLIASGRSFAWTWSGPPTALDRPLWPIVRSAAELLASDNRPRLCECAGDTCSWLFLDRSRNRSRRWCDMKTCGNRAKARRHYRRHRQVGA